MQSIVDLSINLDVDYVRRHKHQLQHFFDDFQVKVASYVSEPLLSYKIRADQFDDTGALWVHKYELDAKSLRLVQTIERSYMSTSFFAETQDKLGSRGYVYYSSATNDDDKMRAILRLINQTSTSIDLLMSLYPIYKDRWEFGIYALFDDIRYKLLILDDCFDSFGNSNTEALDEIVELFYGYLQGTMPHVNIVKDFCRRVSEALRAEINLPIPSTIRAYKEADHPLDNLRFRDTLVTRLENIRVDAIIGIRFGGSELPHLVKKYLPGAIVLKARASNYTDSNKEIHLGPISKQVKSILVLDDNILTGRTLQIVVQELKSRGVERVYFGCVSYSGMKRYPQMIMQGHGVVNMDVLSWSCVVRESRYTRIRNSRSYKNSSGVFDKVKATLQRRMNDDKMGYKL